MTDPTNTPTTPEGMRKYDHLPAIAAVQAAWSSPGNHPRWHNAMKSHVWKTMPLLARALDRLVREGPG